MQDNDIITGDSSVFTNRRFRLSRFIRNEHSMIDEHRAGSAGRRGLDKERVDELIELALVKALKRHREETDTIYAPIIVKTIVFGLVALILQIVAVAGLYLWIPRLVVK
jgi:hypothetical protein